MKRSALLLTIAMVLTVPAAAEAKKARKPAAKPAAETVQQIDSNEASWRLVKGALPIFLPSWSMPIYMKMEGDKAEEARKAEDTKQAAPAKKKARSSKSSKSSRS